jgi:hypothetical protein
MGQKVTQLLGLDGCLLMVMIMLSLTLQTLCLMKHDSGRKCVNTYDSVLNVIFIQPLAVQ